MPEDLQPTAEPVATPEALPMPAEGGSYIRNEDGTLTCVEPPTQPAA